MNGDIFVSLLISVVFLNVMKVIPSYNDSSLHLQFPDDPCQDSSSYFHIAGERAFLINVVPFCSLRNAKKLHFHQPYHELLFYHLNTESILTSRGVLNPRPTLLT